MKIIFRISKLELSKLFYSPIAWLLLIIFSLQAGIKFTSLLSDIQSQMDAGISLSGLSSDIFSSQYSHFLWVYIKNNLSFYIPLLTMGLLSKEIGSGSIKLLYSSPIKFRQIVLGKFLGAVAYIIILMLVLFIIVLAAGFAIDQLDYGYVLTGLLGLFLLSCAYASIGLYISSLTSYQIVAAIGTLAVLSLLNLIGNFGQTVPILKDILYWLSISSRTKDFIDGLINSRDIIYLLMVILLFISLTITKLNTERKVFSKTAKAGIYVGLVLVFIITVITFSRPTLTLYKDMTGTKMRTLTTYSQEVVSKMRDLKDITTYVNILDPMGFRTQPASQNSDKETLGAYTRFLPYIEHKYVYFYDSTPDSFLLKTPANAGLPLEEVARKMAKSYKIDFEEVLTPKEIKERIDLSSEDNYMIRVVRYKDREATIRFYQDNGFYASEAEITPTLKTLVADSPVVGFVTGHGERSAFGKADNAYSIATTATRPFRHALISKGFSFKNVVLSEDTSEIKDIDILVISDPRTAYSEQTIQSIINYLDNGGNLILACEPVSYSHVNPLLDYLNVKGMPGVLNQNNKDLDNDFILAQLHANSFNLHNDFEQLVLDTKVSFPSAMGLKIEPFGKFDAKPIVVAPPRETWILKEDLINNAIIDTLILEKPLPLMVALTRKHNNKEQRIIVSGDADFMSNMEYFRRNVKVVNSKMVNPLFSWLAYGEYPGDIERPPLKDTQFTLSEKGLSSFQAIFIIVLPALILISGIILLFRRKRK